MSKETVAGRAWRIANSARRKVAKREWDLANKQHIYQYNRNRRFTNPSRVHKWANSWYSRSKHRRGATVKMNQAKVAVVARDIIARAKSSRCIDCNRKVPSVGNGVRSL